MVWKILTTQGGNLFLISKLQTKNRKNDTKKEGQVIYSTLINASSKSKEKKVEKCNHSLD